MYNETQVMDVTSLCCVKIINYRLRKKLIKFKSFTENRRDINKYFAIAERKNTAIAESCHTLLGPRLFNFLPNEVRKSIFFDTTPKHTKTIIKWIKTSEVNLIKKVLCIMVTNSFSYSFNLINYSFLFCYIINFVDIIYYVLLFLHSSCFTYEVKGN